MTAKPVAAGTPGPALPLELAAGAAGGNAAAGPASAAKKTAAASSAVGEAASAKAARARTANPGAGRSGAKLGKTVDKALGKKPPAAASAPRARASGGSGTSATSGYSSAAATQASGEWAFLQDKNLPIEEKVFRYMMLLQRKADTELQQFLEATGPGGKAATSSAKQGTSLFDIAKAIVPALGLAEGLIGEAGLKKLATQLAGPVLAAAATAAGMPALAPVALQLGGSMAQMAFQDVGARSTSGSTSSTPTANEYSKMSDKEKALWLQHLMEKQQAMFTAASNTLKCMHDTQMAAISNIR